MMLEIAAHGLSHLDSQLAKDVALAMVRVGTGSFFAISGYNKLFNPERHCALVQTLKKSKVPAIGFNQWWVPGWEFLGGAMLVAGLFSAFAAFVLMVICMVACYCEAKDRVDAYGPINFGDRIADYLYLPEVLYIILLAVNVVAGTGAFSLDAVIFPRS